MTIHEHIERGVERDVSYVCPNCKQWTGIYEMSIVWRIGTSTQSHAITRNLCSHCQHPIEFPYQRRAQ